MHETASATLSDFDLAAMLVVAAALLGWANYHFIRLPHVIGLTVMGALAAGGLMVANAIFPGLLLDDHVKNFLTRLNFTQTLLEGMLCFLLFAGALHVDLDRLKASWLPVALLSTLGVVVSTAITGAGMWALGGMLGLAVPPIWYFVFGALIAPTDPVSVLGVLKEEAVPADLQAAVAGESLFNDGVGIVVFTMLLGAALTGQDFSIGEGLHLFAIEAGGGVVVGLLLGWIGFKALASMDEYSLEVLVTLAIVMGGYALSSALHVSGPLAMAVAGLLIGNYGVSYAMSDVT
ncbi:MAG: cation:proton antiporter, partial [Sphingomonadales bacterium]|nr:cation:proton antiporter [Sphingomonadales bacterium]